VRVLGRDDDAQSVQRIVCRIWFDYGLDTRAVVQSLLPEVEYRCFSSADSLMITGLPCFQGRHRPEDAFLADFHSAANAHVLQERTSNQVLAACKNARSRATEKLVPGIENDVGSLFKKDLQVVFGRCVHDDRYAPSMSDFDELR